MGLTGVVTEARVRLLAIETDRVLVDTDRLADLDELLSAWPRATGAPLLGRLGRLHGDGPPPRTRGAHAGDHASAADLAGRDPLAPRARGSLLRVPRQAPSWLLNRASIRAFNEAWFRQAPRHREGQRVGLGSFFHPLDASRLEPPLRPARGRAVPAVRARRRADAVRRAIELLATAACRAPPVLKRFGPGDAGPLSFPMAGWTLALDMPVGPAQLAGVLDASTSWSWRAAGASTSPRTRASTRATCPRCTRGSAASAELRARLDPDGVLASDLSRRLGV